MKASKKRQTHMQIKQGKKQNPFISQDKQTSGIQVKSQKKIQKNIYNVLNKKNGLIHSQGDSLSIQPSPLLSESMSFNNSLEQSLQQYLKLHYQNGRAKSDDFETNSNVGLVKAYLSELYKIQVEADKNQEDKNQIQTKQENCNFVRKINSLGDDNKQSKIKKSQTQSDNVLETRKQVDSRKDQDSNPSNLKPQVKKRHQNQSSFGKSLKISKRISYQGQIFQNDLDLHNFQQPSSDGHIHFPPNLWHQVDEQPTYIRESLKKQRPPLIQHSQLNYESSGSYFQEQAVPIKMSEFEIDNKYSHSMKKNFLKLPSFKQSQILNKNSCDSNDLNPTQSVIETLEGFHKKLQKQKKQQIYTLKADSSSEQDDACDKIMAISCHKNANNQNQDKQTNNFLITTRKQIFYSNLLQPINQNAQELKDASQLHSKVSEIKQPSEYQQSSKLRSNSFSDVIQQIQNKYSIMIDQIKFQHEKQVRQKDTIIDQLFDKISNYQQKIRCLQHKNIQIEKSKEQLSMKILTMSLKIQQNQYGQQISSQGSLSLTKKMLMQNQQAKKVIQQKDELIYTLSRELQLLNSMNSQYTSKKIHNSKGIAIEFIDKANQFTSLLQHSSAMCNCQFTYSSSMEQIILKYEHNILKNIEMINILQKCLQQSIKELLNKQSSLKISQKTISHLLGVNQNLQKNIQSMKNQMILIAETYELSRRNESQKEKSTVRIHKKNKNNQFADIFQGDKQLSICSTIKM